MIEEKEELFAVFLDTVGIQSYIFSSNKLKENVGASYLVEEIFISYLKIVLIEIGIRLTDDDLNFSNNPDTFKLLKIKKEGLDFEIGYIGGGNALLLFKKETIAKLFIQNWSRILLLYTPGLKTSVSLLETTIQELENEYQKFYKKLYELLDENKQSHSPLVTLPQHGIMAPCKLTDFSSEIHEEKDNKKKYDYISSIAYAKLNEKNLEKANKKLQEFFIPNNIEHYQFTNDIESLGQEKSKENYIAIIHIDGNDMGKLFKEKGKSLFKTREIASKIKNIAQEKFKKLIEDIIELDKKNNLNLNYDDKAILPIRPVIFGGDDITFITEGKLGIWSAYTLLKHLSKETIEDRNFSACAGVAITNTKFPLYKGYKLAEESCRNAKKIRKEKKDQGSWIDFHIHYKGLSGSLTEIRNTHFQSPQGNLCKYRPYKVNSTAVGNSFKIAIENTNLLKNEKKWPSNVIHKFREVLTLDKTTSDHFMQENKLKYRTLDAFNVETHFKQRLFSEPSNPIESNTPYFDMIELSEFYPDFLLEESINEEGNGK